MSVYLPELTLGFFVFVAKVDGNAAWQHRGGKALAAPPGWYRLVCLV